MRTDLLRTDLLRTDLLNTDLLALPPSSLEAGGALITGQCMTFPPSLPYDAWAAMDNSFDRAEMGLGWWRGDWYNHGEDHYAEFAQLLDVNEAKRRTCQNNGSVCRQYTPSDRSATGHLLSFSHHAAAAYLDKPLRLKLLWLAIGGGWSCAKMRDEIKALSEKQEEAEAQEDMGVGRPVNSEFIAIDLPLTVKALGTLILDHLDPADEEVLRDWLSERLGNDPAAGRAAEEQEEEWHMHSARMIREAIEEAEAYVSLPSTYTLAGSRLAQFIESQGQV